MADPPSDFRSVVRAHHGASEGILVAGREPCITIAQDERRSVRGRSFRIVAPEQLPLVGVGASWIMAVLLCPGDDAAPVARWVRGGGHDARRVLFYLHPDTDLRAALEPWARAGLVAGATWTVASWKQLHKHLGAHWNVRIFDDFRGA
ncbi:MAG: hypothetical protein LC624_11400 [Halobacteriales archaeon]|nr:hypothetical protein [Halobacteriales archaeon]